jgi:cell division protease FtsH
MFFVGRVAEELIFGAEKVTTGAGNDIERATGLARRMVTQFGMSERVGAMSIGEREQEVFLGRDFGHRREVSERTAEMVDDEVKRLLDEAYAKAAVLLTDHKDLLERIAQALLDRETIDREDLKLLVKNMPLPPREAPPLPPAPAAPAAAPKAAAPVALPSLGAPPAEPAGA